MSTAFEGMKANMAKGRGKIANWRPADGSKTPKKIRDQKEPSSDEPRDDGFNLGTFNLENDGNRGKKE